MENTQIYDIPDLRARMQQQLSAFNHPYPKSIEEDFPHVLAKIVELWGTAELDNYFDSLLVANRPGRQGFPANAATEIFRLSFLHGSLDLRKGVKTSGWSSVSDGEISKIFDKQG